MTKDERHPRPVHQNYYAHAPVKSRMPVHWPREARVACAIVVCAEYYEMQPPHDAFMPPTLPGGFGRGPYPDFRNYSVRSYGNRVGIFRVLEALDAYGFTATVALDALTAQLCPQLLPHILRRGFEIVGHGQSVSRMISSRMSERQERDYLCAALETIERLTGIAPKGWHGPEYGESARTPALLAQLGIDYLLDWPNDEQPIMMDTEHGRITSIPMLVDFDDVYALYQRRLTVARWRQAVEEGIDQLVEDASDGGRLLVINLHPWLIGHPFRIGALEDVLSYLVGRKELWLATTGEIASWFASTYQKQ